MGHGSLVHDTFSRETVENFYKRMNEENKYDSAYFSYYSVETSPSQPLPPPSKQCELLKQKILSNWKEVFKNKLGKEDRVSIEPVHLSLKPGSVPVYNARPFDTPFHLRPAYDRELKDMLDAKLI